MYDLWCMRNKWWKVIITENCRKSLGNIDKLSFVKILLCTFASIVRLVCISGNTNNLCYMFKEIEHFSMPKEKLETIYKQYCNAKLIGNALPKFSTDEVLSRTRMTTTSWIWLINLCRHVVCYGLAKSSQVTQMSFLKGETSNIYCYSCYDTMGDDDSMW